MGTPAAPDWDSLIPIDPALQSQSQPQSQSSPAIPYTPYTGYTQHYQQQQAAYQAYQLPPQQQHQQYTPAPAPTPARQDTSSVSTLNDAVASAGVDLRAEEEKLHTTTAQSASSSSRPRLDRSRTQPLNPNFDVEILKPRLAEIAAHHKLTGGIPEEIATYVALALRTRLEQLVRQMSVAARHRTDTQFDRPALYGEGLPMWSLVVRSDVAKQAAVLERVEREEETKVRRERKERAEMTAAHTAALAAQAAGGSGANMDYDDDESGKRKKKKDGPGVTARNMSEDVRKKMSNAVASQAAGIGGKYSWMTAGNAAAAAAKPVKAASAAPSTPSSTTAGTSVTTTTGGTGWARAYVPKKTDAAAAPAPPPVEEDMRTAITIRDAQFVVEKERGHGGGRGSGKGWT